MVEAERFVDGLKAAGVEFFAVVPAMFPCGCHSTDKGAYCINELYQKGLFLHGVWWKVGQCACASWGMHFVVSAGHATWQAPRAAP